MARIFHLPEAWPLAGDPAAAAAAAERIAVSGPGGRRLALDPAGARMIAAIAGNSPYLADLATRETRTLRRFALFGPNAVMRYELARIAAADPAAPRAAIARLVRQAKRRAGLAIALADIGSVWPLARITGALSDLAERTLELCIAHLLRGAHDQGRLRLPDPAHPWQGSGFAVLGMGKLGGGELNFSSDIDLILLFDPAMYPADQRDDLGAAFTRVARDLVTLMQRRDQDGYVFRIDLRLRPDPAATPPAVSLPAAIAYYESTAQNWERAAMIKARPLAGDRLMGQRFLDQIKPFIWRRQLDFAAINDIAVIKHRIDQHRGVSGAALAQGDGRVSLLLGHDVKRGEGGIREIEFIAQTLQLVWGGRDPTLRRRDTVGTLGDLAATGHISRTLAEQLIESYEFLRRVEHRIQMIDDRQTHRLPGTLAGFAALAGFLGFGDANAFAVAIGGHFAAVRASFDAWFGQLPVPELAPGMAIDSEDDAATGAVLADLGFAGADRIVAAIAEWRAGRPRALRSERARALLDLLLPTLLRALADQAEPDLAFARFNRLLIALPAGVQLLALCERNSGLIGRLATVMGAAPALADHLAQVPAAIEGLLAEEQVDPHPRASLARQLADSVMLEDHIAVVRSFIRGEEFRLSLATVEGRIDTDQAGGARTALADAAMQSLLAPVLADHLRRFGAVAGGGFGVLALGKAGGREMLAGSDLDLMLIYDHDATAAESDGPKRLAPGPYFNRLAQGFIAAMVAPGVEGPLYALDMRLRPSGKKGPVAVSLAAFRDYHQADSWTWERMALTRARIVVAPAALGTKLQAALAAILTRAVSPARLRWNAAQMRARIARDLPPRSPWEVKLRAGGLIEIEFIAQALQLIHAPENPGVLATNTRDALDRLAAAGFLAMEDAALLIRAGRAWRTIQGLLRLMAPAPAPAPAVLPVPADTALRRDLAPDLENFILYLSERVRSIFIRLIGDPKDIIS